MKYAICLLLCIASSGFAQRKFLRPVQVVSYSDDGRYSQEGAYNSDDSGAYRPDNSGQYSGDDGRYVHDGSGVYSGQNDPYRHVGDGGSDGSGGSGGNGGRRGSVIITGTGVDSGSRGSFIISGSADSGSGFDSGVGIIRGSDVSSTGSSGASDSLRTASRGSASGFYENKNYAILRQTSHAEDDGYHYVYETENGITAEEQGKLENRGTDSEAMKASGFYSYTGPDNVVYTVRYTADENGFVPEGDHLPKAPPIPEAIARALEYLRSTGKL